VHGYERKLFDCKLCTKYKEKREENVRNNEYEVLIESWEEGGGGERVRERERPEV
jgi:hypothetical protein